MVKNKQQGFATVEILIAAAIMVIVFSGVVLLIMGSQKTASDTETAHEGQLLNQKYLEEARSLLMGNFNSNSTLVDNYDSSDPQHIYKINRTEKYITQCVKEITSRVDWSIESNAQYVTATTQITNPNLAFLMGGACNTGTPPGSNPWQNCYPYGEGTLQGPDQDGYDVDITRIGSSKYAFIVTHPKNQQNAAEDLWIYNVDNKIPDPISSLDSNSLDNVGINTITVARASNGTTYAFLGNDRNQEQIIVENVSNPAALPVPTKIMVTGFGVATDSFYFDDKVYFVSGNTIAVLNVNNLSTPPVTFTLDGQINKIYVTQNYIYAATADKNGEITRISTSNYASKLKLNLNGNGNNTPAATSVYVVGNRLYIGMETSNQNQQNFQIYDDSGNGFTLVAANDLNYQNGSTIPDIVVVGKLAFVVSTSANDEFEVYDITTPAAPLKKCSNNNNPTNIGFGLDYFENYIYLAMRSNNELQIFADHQ